MEIGTMNGQMELLCELVVSYSHYKRQAPPPHTHTDHMDNAYPRGGRTGGGGAVPIFRENNICDAISQQRPLLSQIGQFEIRSKYADMQILHNWYVQEL